MDEEGKPPKELRQRGYRPLDVRTWSQAWLTTLGWILVPCFAVLSTVLFFLYEMKYINISDRDLRDMYLDQRLMNTANNYNHKYFINGVSCCNSDFTVFGDYCMQQWLSNDYYLTYAKQAPFCPPLIQIQCPGSVTSVQCNQARAVLYPLLGMDPTTGAYVDCAKAGQLLIGVQIAWFELPFMLNAIYHGSNVGQMVLGSWDYDLGTNIDVANVTAFVENIRVKYASKEYVNPNVRLPKAFTLAGKPITLDGPRWIPAVGRKRTIKQWPVAIFNWPSVFKNGGRCNDTATQEIWYLQGQTTVSVPDFNYYSPTSMVTSLTFLNDQMMIGSWRLQPLGSSSTTVDQLSDAVSLQIVSSILIYVGMVPEMGACFAWMIDESMWGTNVTYSEVWRGSLNDLLAMGPVFATNQTVDVLVYDTAAPMLTALPPYGGMWYIVMCFAMAGVWTFTLGPFIVFALPLIWWNVRSNRGLPPVVYRYMKKYRGW